MLYFNGTFSPPPSFCTSGFYFVFSFSDLLPVFFLPLGFLFFPSSGRRPGAWGRRAGGWRRTDLGSVGAAVSGCYWRLRFGLGELADWRWRRSAAAVVGSIRWRPVRAGGCGWPGEGDRGWGGDGSSWRIQRRLPLCSV